jgi:hypothetical protein
VDGSRVTHEGEGPGSLSVPGPIFWGSAARGGLLGWTHKEGTWTMITRNEAWPSPYELDMNTGHTAGDHGRWKSWGQLTTEDRPQAGLL